MGGWLVAERWMTPALFAGVKGSGERELAGQLGSDAAVLRLKRHRDTFIVEKDFKWIHEQGFEAVRLPVGYWIFKPDEGYVAGESYVEKAFLWAEKYDLKVVLDLHGLPGSQNGKAHSGQAGKIHFYRHRNRQQALGVLKYVVERYGQRKELIGIEITNEPHWPFLRYRFTDYCRKAYELILEGTPVGVKCIVSDGFRPKRMARMLRRLNKGEGRLVIDTHLYQAFSSLDRRKDGERYLQTVQRKWRKTLGKIGIDLDIMVGEWSVATAHRVDNQNFTKRYYDAQRELFDECVWLDCYWSYRSPSGGTWDLRSMIESHRV